MDFLTLVTFLLLLIPATKSSSSKHVGNYFLTHRKILPKQEANVNSYAVIFDAGSTASRVHVFNFDQNLELLRIGDDLELYATTKPGLSAYADDPEEAAESLVPLLEKAESVVPEDLRPTTPVRVGATAGLRLLDGNASESILQAVRDLLENNSTLYLASDAVAIIDGTHEGSYLWVAINYLLGNLGKNYSETVGVADLGGGSVQMAYAVSETTAANAPTVADGDDPYITELLVNGTKYYLYVHSYLSYGKEASRAEILKVTADSDYNPCLLAGFNGTYTYSGVEYKATASPSGSDIEECRKIILKALNVSASCPYEKCTFGGIWNGGGGDGQKDLWLATSFYYLPTEAGFADPNEPNSKVRPVDFENTAKVACQTTLEDANSTFPLIDEDALPYLCLDLVYQYTLLVDGFGLDPLQEVTVVEQIQYQDSLVEAAWPLGSAIEAVSSLSNFERLMYFM